MQPEGGPLSRSLPVTPLARTPDPFQFPYGSQDSDDFEDVPTFSSSRSSSLSTSPTTQPFTLRRVILDKMESSLAVPRSSRHLATPDSDMDVASDGLELEVPALFSREDAEKLSLLSPAKLVEQIHSAGLACQRAKRLGVSNHASRIVMITVLICYACLMCRKLLCSD